MQPTSQGMNTPPTAGTPPSFSQISGVYAQEPSGQVPVTATYVQPGDGTASAGAQQPTPAMQQQQQQQQQQMQHSSFQSAPPPQQPQQPTPLMYSQLQELPPQQQTLPIGDHPGNAAGYATADPAVAPKRGAFSIFKRRGEAQAHPNSQGLPQQSAQQAFQPGSYRPAHPFRPGEGAQPNELEPRLPRDAQPMQELVGGNWIFLVFAPYFVATALQDTHLQLGLIIATSIAGGVIIVGVGFWALNLRKVFPYILEVLMPIIFAVQLGVTYKSDSYKKEVMRTFNFTTNSALAGTCLLSMMVCYPVGYQTAQELVHKLYMTHGDVHRCGLYTTAVLTGSLVTSCLLYLAPLCKGYDDRHWNALNLIFRIIYPCVATFLALLFVRFFPDIYLPNLAVVHGLNRRPPARLPGYLEDAMASRPPVILDGAMYQSTVDAAAKAREAATMRPAPYRMQQQQPQQLLTPRYGPGGSMSAGGMPPGSMWPMGQMKLSPVQGRMGMPVQADQLPPEYGLVPGVYPGVEKGKSVYTYFAAGPPSPPPLAVYAVYGDYEAPIPGPMAPSLLQPAPITFNNPLMAVPPRGVQPLQYGGAARVPPYGGPQPRHGGSILDHRRRYGAYAGPPPTTGYMYPEGSPLPWQNYASTGGAGPYGVNMPLGNLAAQGQLLGQEDPAGVLPPMRQPDAVVTGVAAQQPFPRYVRQRPHMGTSGGGYYQHGPRSYTAGRWQAPPPQPPGSLRGPDPHGTYVGTVSMVPAQQPYGKLRYDTDGGSGYGLGAELQQEQLTSPPLPSMDRQQLMPPAAAMYGVSPGPHGGMGRTAPQWRGADVGVPARYGDEVGLQQRPPPADLGQGGYGLDAEVDSNPGALGAPGATTGLMYGRPAGPASRFGLDAEVDTTPPYTPGPRNTAATPRLQPNVRFDNPAGGAADGDYGLDAEVVGR